MLKVFLVEDEFTVREKMKRNINWEENGFCLVGEASDGEVAYPMIVETNPDIIITDIKMPFMDGLELSKLVKENMPQVKIIILSGYDEFEFAKEAINIGITDYLLKPIVAKKLLDSMKKVATIIEKEKQQEAYVKSYHLSEEESKKKARKQFFNELMTYKQAPSELIAKAKTLGIELVAQVYNVFLIKVLINEGAFERYEEIISSLNERMDRWSKEQNNFILFDRETEGWAIVLKTTKAEIDSVEQQILETIKRIMVEYPVLSYCIGVGQRTSRLSEISVAFDGASKALAYRYILNTENIIYYNQVEHYSLMLEKENVSIKNVDISKFDKQTIDDFLKSGVRGEINGFVEEYLVSIGGEINSLLFRQYIMLDIYFDVVAFVEKLGYKAECIVESCGDIERISQVIQSKEATTRYLGQLLDQALLLRDTVSSKRYKDLLDDAKTYIEKNYNKDTISLNSVAEYVNISPNHFSAIFSQEMGQTFISYLIDIRMKKAKELLRCSSMKTLEVGYAVGYKDPHYFSYLFKKTQKCTPKEYRRLNVQDSSMNKTNSKSV